MKHIILALVLWPLGAWAVERYADPAGIASGDCPVSAPCTLARAINLSTTAGDVVYLNDGTYSVGINTGANGAAGNPIIYQSVNAGGAILNSLASGQTDRVVHCDNSYNSFRNLKIAVPDFDVVTWYGWRSEQTTTGCELKDSEVYYTGAAIDAGDRLNLVQARGTSFNIEGNSLHTGQVGVQVSTDAGIPTGTVTGNTIYDMSVGDAENADCVNVASTARDASYGLTISGNTCDGYRDDGFDLLGISNAILEDNTITDPDDDTQTSNSCIKGGNASATGNIIRRNVCIHDETHSTRQYGVVTNGLSNGFIVSNVLVVNSTAIEVAEFGAGGGGGDGNTVIHNTGVGGTHTSSYGLFVNSSVSSLTAKNNYFEGEDADIFVTSGSTATGGSNHLRNNTQSGTGTYTGTDQSGIPGWIGPATTAAGYKLAVDSAMRSAGAHLGSYQDHGNRRFKSPPSIGAWEAASGDAATARTAAAARTAR